MAAPAHTFVPLIATGDQCPSEARGWPACQLRLRVRGPAPRQGSPCPTAGDWDLHGRRPKRRPGLRRLV